MTTPTDAYYMIDRFLRNNLGDDDYAEYSVALEMVRQPQAVAGGEPVGVVGSMPGTAGFTMVCFNSEKVPVGTKLYTAPPPQAVREPLTEAEVRKIQQEAGQLLEPAPFHWVLQVVRNAERHHGITKGGQHGADT